MSSTCNKIDIDDSVGKEHEPSVNPFTNPLPWWYELYKRIKLFPWWIRYNLGIDKEAILKDKIIQLGTSLGLQDKWLKKIIRHTVSEFSKKGLGIDYYGYHNIDHELEATYFVLLSTNGQKERNKFSLDDIKYLFVAALFHDYDPLKELDKPNENSVERFIRNDDKIKEFIDDIRINIDIVIAMIYRTAYPFKGEIADHAKKKMNELFTHAGINENDIETRKHYEDLGWFLSIAERISGYALDNFTHSRDLARRNAYVLGWHPSLINEESVKYFNAFKEEREMTECVLEGIPEEYKKRFWDNVEAFKEAWKEEISVRSSIERKELRFVSLVEKIEGEPDPILREYLLNLHKELPAHIRINEEKFRKSLSDKRTILITLRVNEEYGKIVGYVKGGPLENYKLRRGTHDENMGERTTAYLEHICIKMGYWGATGGHLIRLQFLNEAKKRGYKYVTAYVHRNVIIHRINKGENIEIIQKYEPDRLDYYRYDLTKLVEEFSPSTTYVDIPENNYE
ncbi:MAG: hypothetical protein CMO16_00990 [Thaumarchaeota archaeon]|nr:hypothetical protein [Nitrososphaerota archaeon]